jgi:hypothetical protein
MATCNASSLLTANPFTRIDPGLLDAIKLQLLCDISSSGGGGGTISGSGTAGSIAKFTAGTTLGNSIITESGTVVSVAGSLNVASTGTLGWTDGVLNRDAANAVAIRNGTASQSLRVYNTFTSSTNFERGVFDWQTTANVLRIGTEKGSGGGTARLLSLVYDGVAAFNISSACVSQLNLGTLAGNGIYWSGRTYMQSPADGMLRISNAAGTDFDRIQFGLPTSAAPALKRNAAVLEAKLADDSAYAGFAAQWMSVTDGITAPGAATGRARIYVDSADGDLKVVFADGTVKTLATDT